MPTLPKYLERFFELEPSVSLDQDWKDLSEDDQARVITEGRARDEKLLAQRRAWEAHEETEERRRRRELSPFLQ